MSIGLIFDATGSMSDMISAARDAAANLSVRGKSGYYAESLNIKP